MPKHNALLWSIKNPSNKFTSFLFGTMHTTDLRAFHKKEEALSKIDQVELFATEIDLSEVQNGPGLLSKMLLPNQETLDDHLTPKKYQKIRKRILVHTGIDIHPFRRNKPLILSNIITETLLRKDMPLSLDNYLWEYAQTKEKQLKGIETYEEQLNVMETVPLDYQLRALQSLALNFSNHRKHLEKSIIAYQNEDIWKLYEYSKKGANQLRHLMIYNRNQIMAERMAPLANNHSCFFAIGASHLAGSKGVLRLLKKQGFNMKPIS